MATIVGIARDKCVSGYIGDGTNRWPAVHRLDSAHHFRLAAEQAPAGSTLHTVADEGVQIRDIADVIGRHSERSRDCRLSGRRAQAFHLAGTLPRLRQPGLERADPRVDGLAANAAPGSSTTSTMVITFGDPSTIIRAHGSPVR